jgi:predicted Zn finger-like uncharacterized protein
MRIAVDCQECESHFKVAEDDIGRKVRCPECGARVRVPDPDAEEAPRRRGEYRSWLPVWAWIVAAGVGGAVLAGAAVGVVFSLDAKTQTGRPEPQTVQAAPQKPVETTYAEMGISPDRGGYMAAKRRQSIARIPTDEFEEHLSGMVERVKGGTAPGRGA